MANGRSSKPLKTRDNKLYFLWKKYTTSAENSRSAIFAPQHIRGCL